MTEMARVLVTGSIGFVGSHLVPKLVDKGYDVYSLESSNSWSFPEQHVFGI